MTLHSVPHLHLYHSYHKVNHTLLSERCQKGVPPDEAEKELVYITGERLHTTCR